MQSVRHDSLAQPARTRADDAGHKNPPSAPPAIPPIVIDPGINPVGRHIPSPAIDPQRETPGPPIVPPPGPGLRM